MDDRTATDDYGFLQKRLPPEPVPWARLPSSWRQRSFAGLLWFAMAAFLVGWVIPRPLATPAPDWFLWSCLAVAVVWIVAIVPGGLVDRRRAARLDAARRRDPGKPWLWDHRWDPRGVSGSPFRRFLRAKPRLGGLLVVPMIFTLLRSMSWPELLVYWSLSGLAATWTAWQAWRVYGVGTAHVSFTKFPFHPGERVTLLFGMSDGGARFERVSFSLRRIEEALGNPFTLRRGPRRYFGLQDHRPPGELPGGNQHVMLEFDLPADVPGTHLSASPPAYWALDVLANTSAGPYAESFLIPIYERPAASAA